MTEPQTNQTLARELELLASIASRLEDGRVEIRRSAGVVTVEIVSAEAARIAGVGSSARDAVRSCVATMNTLVGRENGPSSI